MTISALLTLSLSTGVARAHTEKARPAASVIKKEQKPWGIAGDAKAARRTIEVRLLDTMRFVPDRIDVKFGETVRFVMHNAGKVLHELVIGTKPKLQAHAALMLKFPNMEHDESRTWLMLHQARPAPSCGPSTAPATSTLPA